MDPSPSTTENSQRHSRDSLKRIFKIGVLVVVVAFLILAVDRAVDQWNATSDAMQANVDAIEAELASTDDEARIQQLESDLADAKARMPSLEDFRWDRIALAGILYGVGLFPPGWLLGSLVIALGAPVRRRTAISAQLIGHAGKYIPGKVAVVMMRASVMAREGVPLMTSTISVFVETFLMMAVGGFIASLVLLFLPVPVWLLVVAVAMAIVAGLPTIPPVLCRVAAKLTKADRESLRQRLTWPVVFQAWGWSTLSWLFIGGSFAMILSAVPSISPLPNAGRLYPIATAAIALSMAAGFASLLPGGVGVRELVLLTIVAFVTDPAHGMFAAIVARFLFIGVESVLAGASWIAGKIFLRPSPSAVKMDEPSSASLHKFTASATDP